MKRFFLPFFLFIPFITFSQINTSLDVVGGLEYSFRTLITNDNTGKFIASTRSNETGSINYRYGLNFNKRLSDKFLLRTGVRYVQGGFKSGKTTGLRWPSEFDGSGWTLDPSLPHEIQYVF